MQNRHCVIAQWWPQPGQQPAVQNVFQTVPQPEPGSPGEQYQRLSGRGSHAHSGQWMWGWRSMAMPGYGFDAAIGMPPTVSRNFGACHACVCCSKP